MALQYSKLSQDLSSYTTNHPEINWYPGVDVSNHAWNKRQILKHQVDEFCTFMFGGCDAWENFGAFIITDKRGDIKFYNGPSYTNKYSSPQFSSASGNLLGIDFKQQTISFKVGLYYFTIEDYQLFLDYLSPYKVDYLSFGFDDKWSYLVKPSAISDSPRYVLESTTSLYSARNATESETSLIQYTAIVWSETVSSIQYFNEGTGTWMDAQIILRQNGKYYTTMVYDNNRDWRIDGTEISSAETEGYCYHKLSNDNIIQINSVTIDGSVTEVYTTDSTSQLIILPGTAAGLGVVVSYTYNRMTGKKYWYYTELTLKFEVQGPTCAQYIEEYHWDKAIGETTARYQFNRTNLPPSLLDFPFTIDLPLFLKDRPNNATWEYAIQADIQYEENFSRTLFSVKFKDDLAVTNLGLLGPWTLTQSGSTYTINGRDSSGWNVEKSSNEQYPNLFYLYTSTSAKQPINITWPASGDISNSFYVYDPIYASYNGLGEEKNILPYINNSTLNLHYDSESGLLFLMLGDSTLKLLSLTTSTVSGENLIKTLSTTKFQIPGTVRHQNIDNLTIIFTFSGIQVKATDWSDPITCRARTNII